MAQPTKKAAIGWWVIFTVGLLNPSRLGITYSRTLYRTLSLPGRLEPVCGSTKELTKVNGRRWTSPLIKSLSVVRIVEGCFLYPWSDAKSAGGNWSVSAIRPRPFRAVAPVTQQIIKARWRRKTRPVNKRDKNEACFAGREGGREVVEDGVTLYDGD